MGNVCSPIYIAKSLHPLAQPSAGAAVPFSLRVSRFLTGLGAKRYNAGMLRRLFTVFATIAFVAALLLGGYKALASDNDPRLNLGNVQIILHQDNRIFIRLFNGASWQFDYLYPFVPIAVCFLIAMTWNLLVAGRAKKHLQSTVAQTQPKSQLVSGSTRGPLEVALLFLIVAVIVALVLLILYALTWHK